MKAPLDIMDQYTRRARHKPALIVVLPLGLAILSWSSEGLKSLTPVWSFLVWAGGTALMAQVGRDRGRRKEPDLFLEWGGKPTTRLLRFRESENSVLVERRHLALQKALPDLHIPSRDEELADPQRADEIYDTCVRWLLEQTRDQKKFGMLFEENCSYGFRRNLWGIKPIGIAICVLGLAICTWAGIERGWPAAAMTCICGACIVGLLLFWIAWCDSGWVKLAADAYAERLLAAIDTIGSGRSEQTSKTTRPKRTAQQSPTAEPQQTCSTDTVKRERKRQSQPDSQP